MDLIHKIRDRLRRIFSSGVQGRNKGYILARAFYRRLPLSTTIKIRLRTLFKEKILSQVSNNYGEWIRRYDSLTENDRMAIRAHIATFDAFPFFSVVMPVYNTPEEFLRRAIESVRRQIYPHWELCIADDLSSSLHVREILEKYTQEDSRIKVCFREKNGHISAASNSALALSTGDFIALLNHDDELREHALYWMASEIVTHPDTKLLYSDEDKIDAQGSRFDPYFKPDWNPELLLGQNYISHLGVYHRERILAIGGFREGYKGAQDWDLVLRFTEDLDPRTIRHIPAVLYHWRSIPGSTAVSLDTKSYATQAQYLSLSEALSRRGEEALIESVCERNFWLPHFKVNKDPLVSIIIPTRNGVDLLRQCLDSLGQTDYPHTEILVIDNQSDDPETLAYLSTIRKRPNHRVLSYPYSFNYALMHNWAVPQTSGEYLCLLNNDTEVVSPGWLNDMLGLAQRPGIAAVGAKLLYPDGSLQHGGVILGIDGVAGHAHKGFPGTSYGYFGRASLLQSFSAVTAACLLMKKADWEDLGGMNTNLTVGFNDVDLCLRLREKGLRNLWTPGAVLYHHESKTRGFDTYGESMVRSANENAYMQWRWGKILNCDPAYNPNLTLLSENFSLAWPPRHQPPWKLGPKRVDVPFGFNVIGPEMIPLNPNTDLSGSFPLPCNLQGELTGISILCRNIQGSSSGTLTFRLEDEVHCAEGTISLSEYANMSPLPLPFSGGALPLHGQERLSFCLRLKDTTDPIGLYSYPLGKEWGHGIPNYTNNALRIVLHLVEEE